MKIRLAVPALLACALFVGACASQSKPAQKSAASMGIVNTKCPISHETLGEDGWDKVTTVKYNGQNVGFCCSNCPKKFEKMTDAQKAAAVAAAK